MGYVDRGKYGIQTCFGLQAAALINGQPEDGQGESNAISIATRIKLFLTPPTRRKLPLQRFRTWQLERKVSTSLYGKIPSTSLEKEPVLTESDLDSTPMDINLIPCLDIFCISPQPQTPLSTISNTTGADASPGQASSVGMTNSKGTSITSAGGGKSPSISLSTSSSDFQSTTLY